MAEKFTRVQLQMPESGMKRLDRLMKLTGFTAYVQVFRQSLRAYEWLVDETIKGAQIQICHKDGRVETIKLFVDAEEA